VAGVASLILWHTVVLVVRCRKPCGIVDAEAASVWLHQVTRKAETGFLRAIHMLLVAERDSERWKDKERDKCKNLAATARRYSRSQNDNRDYSNRDDQYGIREQNRH